MNLYGSDLFGFPREWFSEERDDADVFAPPRFWIVAPRSFLLPDDEDDDFDDDVDPFNREHHREGEEKEATKTRILFSHKHTHTHTSLSLSVCVCVCVSFSLKTLSLCVTAVRALYLIEHLTRHERKIFSREKERNERHAPRIRVEDPKQKKPPKISLWTKTHRRATRRDRLV
jgi:hypothetical protein